MHAHMGAFFKKMIEIIKNNPAKRNAAAYYFQFGVAATVTLFISPLLLGYLGPAGFGAWRLVQRWIEILTFADGRAGQYLKIELARLLGRQAHANELVSVAEIGNIYTVRRVLQLLAILVLASAALAFGQSQLKLNSVGFDYIYFSTTLGFAALLASLATIPEAALTAASASYKSAIIQALGVLLGGIVTTLYVYCQGATFYIGMCLVVSSAATFVAMNSSARSTLRWYSPSYKFWAKLSVSRASKLSQQVSLWFATEKLLLAADILMVGWFLGTKDVADYTFSGYIYQTGISISLLGTSAKIPFLAQALGRDDFERVDEIKKSMRRKVIYISFLIGAVLVLVNRHFVTRWAGEAVYLGLRVDILMAVSLIQLNLIRCECQIQDAHGRFGLKSFVLLASIGLAFAMVWLASLSITLSPSIIILISIVSRVPAHILLAKLAR
jgi:hypothetical protein